MAFKGILLLGTLFLLFHFAKAQPTSRHLAVEHYPLSSLPSFLSQLKNAKEDTAKVSLLLKIASIYHWNESIGSADSATLFARSAAELSKNLKYTEGHNEATFLICKSLTQKKDFKAAERILREVYGEQYIRLLLVLSEYYINSKDAKPEELRKAYPFLQMASRMSNQGRSRHWITESCIAEAKYHFRFGEINQGRDCFYKVIQYYEQIGDKAGQAHWWLDLARYLPEMGTYDLQIYSYGKARALFKELKNTEELADCLHEEGTIHSRHARLDLTEKFYLAELKLVDSTGMKTKLFASYQRLSSFYQKQNNLDQALRYALMGLENLKSIKDSSQLNSMYWTTGDIYNSLGDHPTSIKYYKLALSTSVWHIVRTYTLVRRVVDAEIRTGNATAGLDFLKSFLRAKGNPETTLNKQLVAFLFGNCYAAINDFKTAEKYYLEMIRLNKEVEPTEKFWWRNANSVSGPAAYLTIGRFYTEQGKFEQAGRYVKTAMAYANLTPAFEMDGRYLIYKTDSVAGNHLASMRNYQRYIFLRDSIQRITKDEQVAVMKANFKTAQKEKDIKLLKNEALLRKRQLELKTRTEKFTYAGIVALFGLLMVLYNGYRVKKNKNLQLEEQQKTINTKNSSLLRLVDEKEWLLKEVHHRVKNNLQIVISLLNSQSAHLKEEVAVSAIVESRHRIQAISMLHHRIYQSENMVGIAMVSYIHELVYYLDNSFNLGKRIIFSVSVETIELDLSQAVPIGLILNEAITNSLKYAFPDDREGEIIVSFKKVDQDKLVLSIADDGIGLPLNFNVNEIGTFGLKLIQGLTEDLEGTFTLQSEGGTTLLIAFTHRMVTTSLPTREELLGLIEL
ncbi:hypothetical protein LZD49_03620 [Dyadobacter sp. CY261]|uniref:tetratricopeptide repeat-containing sensor histidine kinase n=1 Tax=Dyadobacter sp. CY261 TaxID=2907203 RepID=UPI001F383F30|nr:histidine kinase dimerization/phosphoacceptor domain -containing protein [Dyadobacter sp. CY261]MCF0069545.1 hypothetical protein [Dyadobacter sp. CY261]